MRVVTVHQNPTPKAAPPSGPSMTRGRSASRKKKGVRGRSQTGSILRQPCRYDVKGTYTRSPCEYWHPPECQFFKNESGCFAGDKCLFPHSKVEEQPGKKPKKGFQNGKKRRQGCCSCCENCTTIGLCLERLRAVRTSEKKREISGKPRQNIWDQSDEYDSHSLRHVKQVSEQIKDHRMEKNQSKFLVSEVPNAVKFEDRSQEETARQERCARGKAWILVRNIYKLKEKHKATFYSPANKWIMPSASTIKPEEREFVADSGASMHMVSIRKTLTPPNWRP